MPTIKKLMSEASRRAFVALSPLSSHPMHRDVLSEFTHLRDVAMQVAELIADVRVHMDTPKSADATLELEARFGNITDTQFHPNVGKETFCGILQLLESFPRWSRVTPWQETQDVFYTAELPNEYGGEPGKTYLIRTSVGVDASNQDIQIVHNYKQRLRNVDMELCHMDGESCCMNVTRDRVSDGFDVRVSASLEQKLPHHILPIAVSPEMVRIKQRKRFFLHSLGVEGDTFSFDVSLVYTGKTKSEAEQKQSQQVAPSFEIEVECLKPNEYLRTTGGEDIMLALSLILKCYDFSAAMHTSTNVTYKPTFRRQAGRDSKHKFPILK